MNSGAAPSSALPFGTDKSIPMVLRQQMAGIISTAAADSQRHLHVLLAAEARLAAALATLQEDPLNLRPIRDVQRKLDDVRKAVARLQSGAIVEETKGKLVPYVDRYKQLEKEARERRRMEAEKSATSKMRYLPRAPEAATPSSSNVLMEGIVALGGGSSSSGGGGGDAPLRPLATTHQGFATLDNLLTRGQENSVKVVMQELRYAFGELQRPVDLMPFDMCPKCRVAMKYNPTMQQLVCPVPNCHHWKRFADMTSSALPFGEEIEFCKYTYRPVTHLDDTMKFAEGAEAYVIPVESLEKAMKVLAKRRVKPEDLTIPMVREICKQCDVKVENAVQLYSRLSGRAPRRMTAFMKDQMRIMFNTQEEPYHRHCGDRMNNLSFPYTLYKYCELLGYWEMLESLPLLRGPSNLSKHDSILSKVCQDLDWQYIPTVSMAKVA